MKPQQQNDTGITWRNQENAPEYLLKADPKSAPYDQSAERALIGAVLVAGEIGQGNSAFNEAMLDSRAFYTRIHGFIWRAMQKIALRGDNVEHHSVASELKAHTDPKLNNVTFLDLIGGEKTLIDLEAARGGNIEQLARQIKRCAIRRAMLDWSDQLRVLSMSPQVELESLISQASEKMGLLTNEVAGIYQNWESVADATTAWYAQYIDTYKKPNLSVTTGYSELDELLLGWKNGAMHIVAGRMRMGKSAWLLNACWRSIRQGVKAAYISLEMTRPELIMRLTSIVGQISNTKIQTRTLSADEHARMSNAVAMIRDTEGAEACYLEHMRAPTMSQIKSLVHQLVRGKGVEAVYIDFIDHALITKENPRETTYEHITKCYVACMEMALRYDIPIVVAAQVKREVANRQDKRPQLSDIEWTDKAERYAYSVSFLYRDEVYNEATEFPNQAELIVAKNRGGRTGTIMQYFEKSTTTFVPATVTRVQLEPLGWDGE